MSEQPTTPADDEVEGHLRSNAPVTDSRWTTGEDVAAHLKAHAPDDVTTPVDGRTYPADGDDDVEGHLRSV